MGFKKEHQINTTIVLILTLTLGALIYFFKWHFDEIIEIHSSFSRYSQTTHELKFASSEYIATNKHRALVDWEGSQKALQDFFSQNSFGPDSKNLEKKITSNLNRMNDLKKLYLSNAHTKDELFRSRIGNQIASTAEAILIYSDQLRAGRQEHVYDKLVWLILGALFVLLIIFILAVVPSLLTTKKMITSLEHLRTATRKFSQGEFDLVPPIKLHSEFNEVSQDFRKMSESIQATNYKLSQEKLKAEQANLAKSTFLSVMSHEIRTPLNLVVGFGDLMLNENLTKTQMHYINNINSSAKLLLSIINNILDLSRIESGEISINPEVIDLKSLINTSVDRFAPQSLLKNVTMEITFGNSLPQYVVIDPHILEQVLTNLLSNAFKFTKDGAIKLHADLLLENTLEFRVYDSGKEITDNEMEKIFSPFYQADPFISRKNPGTGLGLAICKKLTHLVGGSIDVQILDQNDKYTKYFWFHFPFNAANTQNLESSPKSQSTRAINSALSTDQKYNILLVDDVEDNRELIKVYLRKFNIEITESENGIDAVDKITQNHDQYDLVLMDIQMPEMDGLTATDKIREYESKKELSHIPIVVLSAHAYRDVIQTAKEHGVSQYLTKPIKKGELLQKLNMFLD